MTMNLSQDAHRALKEGDKNKLSILRLMLAAIRQKEIDSRKELSEKERWRLLGQLAKQRQESINQFEAAGRKDLADKEKYELSVIRSYLPQPLEQKTLQSLVEKTIAELEADGIKDMGKVMHALKEKTAERADMKMLSQWVREKLSGTGS